MGSTPTLASVTQFQSLKQAILSLVLTLQRTVHPQLHHVLTMNSMTFPLVHVNQRFLLFILPFIVPRLNIWRAPRLTPCAQLRLAHGVRTRQLAAAIVNQLQHVQLGMESIRTRVNATLHPQDINLNRSTLNMGTYVPITTVKIGRLTNTISASACQKHLHHSSSDDV